MPGDLSRTESAVAELAREGEYWTIVFAGRELRTRDSKGMGYLAELLAHPGREVPVLALAGGSSAKKASAAEAHQAGLAIGGDGDIGPVLDAEAKRSYRDRLSELESELEQANRFNDPERAAQLRIERDAIIDELAAATGAGGRDRRTGSAAERARLNVTRAIRTAIARIADSDEPLGEHLSTAVHTGQVCVYRPDPNMPISWSVSTRRPRSRPTRRFHPPETSYAHAGDVSIAYQVLGNGPHDVVFVFGWLSHLDFHWTDPSLCQFFRQIASFSRLIVFDKRGTGLSDPFATAPTLEERIDDITAVMDAASSDRATLIGYSEGGTICALFAATYPERVRSLILYDTWAAGAQAAAGMPGAERWREGMDRVRATIDHWGQGQTMDCFAPSLAGDPIQRRFWGMFERAALSPGMARALLDANYRTDVRPALPSIQARTLVLHHPNAAVIPREQGRYLAEHIPNARYVELPGPDHAPVGPDIHTITQEIEDFLTTAAETAEPEPETVLATILVAHCTVPNSGSAADASDPLQQHDPSVDATLEALGGTRTRSDDGLIAAFDGPARAIRCATQLRDLFTDLGINIRIGLHTGECTRQDGELHGTAVKIAREIAQLADEHEPLASQTIRDLVIGSGLAFIDRGEHRLHSAHDKWRLYSVAREPPPNVQQDRFEVTDPRIPPGLSDRATRALVRHAPGVPRSLTKALRSRNLEP